MIIRWVAICDQEVGIKEVHVNSCFHGRSLLFSIAYLAMLAIFSGPLIAHEPREMARMQQTIDILTKQLADANTKIRRLEASVASRRGRPTSVAATGCDVGDARANVQLADGKMAEGEALESWIRDFGKNCSQQELTQLKLLANELFYGQSSLDLIDLLR